MSHCIICKKEYIYKLKTQGNTAYVIICQEEIGDLFYLLRVSETKIMLAYRHKRAQTITDTPNIRLLTVIGHYSQDTKLDRETFIKTDIRLLGE